MKNGSILVVDDDLDIVCNAIDILTDMGFHADSAVNGHAALQRARAKHYDVALLDLKLPDMDGVELYRQLKSLQPSLVAIMLTAYSGIDAVVQAKDAGVWRVLRKPVDFESLLTLINDALHQPLLLVVDDDTDFCSNLWQLLRDQDYRVDLAHDEAKAREKIATRPYETVILDMKLGDKSGEEVFASFESSSPRPQTLLVTGCRSSTNDRVEELLNRGAEAVCYKPIEMGKFLETLDELTQHG